MGNEQHVRLFLVSDLTRPHNYNSPHKAITGLVEYKAALPVNVSIASE